MYDIQATLTGDLAELYAAVLEAFEDKGDIAPSEANRILVQTGAIQHLTMLQGLGVLDAKQSQAVTELVDRLSKDTLMWDIVQLARQHWRDTAASSGTIDLQAFDFQRFEAGALIRERNVV